MKKGMDSVEAIRRSRTVLAYTSNAAAAAFSQDSGLVPTSLISLYNLADTVAFFSEIIRYVVFVPQLYNKPTQPVEPLDNYTF
jgi:hypothetical protein